MLPVANTRARNANNCLPAIVFKLNVKPEARSVVFPRPNKFTVRRTGRCCCIVSGKCMLILNCTCWNNNNSRAALVRSLQLLPLLMTTTTTGKPVPTTGGNQDPKGRGWEFSFQIHFVYRRLLHFAQFIRLLTTLISSSSQSLKLNTHGWRTSPSLVIKLTYVPLSD